MNEFELVKKAIRCGVSLGFKTTEEGFRLFIRNKPSVYRDVVVATEVKNEVIEWLLNPRRCEPEEWDRLREPLWEIALTWLNFIFQHGDIPKELFMTMIEKTFEKAES